MSAVPLACPGCGLAATRKNGRDRQGRQVYQCRHCLRRFTMRRATPFSGYRFPPDVIALAVRWYLRFRLSSAEVAALLAERGIGVDASTVYDWARAFAPLDEDAARPCRHAVGRAWSVDETYARVAGAWVYVYRAIDGQGQVVDVDVSEGRAAAEAATCFRRAIAATGTVPDEVTTDGAAASPPALIAARPPVAHETGQRVQQRIERDHQHLQGRLRPRRGCKTLAGAPFLRNLRGQVYDLGRRVAAATLPVPPAAQAWNTVTSILLGR